jgi:SAM-dependent methyltransferase
MPVRATTRQLARVGPVHFQSLESELAPVARYLKGRMLNAGCGNRDLAGIAAIGAATSVVNYDVSSKIPGAVLGPLSRTPFGDQEFDAILCNAVLEHVPGIDTVMRELVRILKRGGHLVVAVPFLQPYHPDPTDFRRYTRAGLEELGALHDLRVIEMLPVHTIWQTLGWIAWRWAVEKGGVRRYAVYPAAWIMTRLFHRTDSRLSDNANTYQAVFMRK